MKNVGTPFSSSNLKGIDRTTADHMLRCAELSYRMEIERGESTSARAAKTLTAVSVIAVGVVTSISLLPPLSPHSQTIASISYSIVLLLLVGSLILCLLSQFGFSYKSLVSPEQVIKEIDSEGIERPFESEVDAAKHFAISIEESYQSIRSNNTQSKKLLNWALIALILALAFILIGCILCHVSESTFCFVTALLT